MPQPYDYSTQQVNVGNYFDALKSGREEKSQMDDATRQTALQKYMPGALNGDAEAQQQAFANATPDQAVQLKQALMQMEDRDLQKAKAMQDKFAGQAQWANTPERWAQVTQMAEAEGLKGAAQIPFELRGAKLAGMMTVKEQLDQEWKRRDFELKTRETNASVAAKNAAADASRRSGQGGGGNWSDPGGDGDGLNPYDGISDPKQRDMMYRQLTTDFNARQRDYQKDRIEAQNILAATDEFLALNKKVGSGGVTGSGGISSMPIVNSARNMVDSDWARMNAITDKLTPLMRQGLPGAASDRDMQTFRGATVGTGKLGEANVGIARGLQVAAKNAIDKGLFDEAYFRRNRHLQGSDNAWSRYLEENPIFDPRSDPTNPELNRSRKSWREYVSPSAQAAPSPTQQTGGIVPGTVEDGYVFRGGDPSNPANWSEAQ
jgi:hypothetical protein